MPRVGFEAKVPAFERAKTVHTLDHAATAIGKDWFRYSKVNMEGWRFTDIQTAWIT
jgi:hypothetical protein